MTRSSRQRGEMVCTVCQTRTSPLWRRGDKGEVLCNACGLYHKHHKKPRPISLANSSARSARRTNHQNNENKIQSQRFQNIIPNINGMNPIRPYPPYHQQAIAPALTPVNATASNNMKSANSMSPNLPPMMFNNGNNNNNNMNGNGNMYNSSSMATLSPTFKMTSNIGSGSMPIPIKKNMATTSVNSTPQSLSPPMNTPPHLLKMNNNTNQPNNNEQLPLPTPLAQKNNSDHGYNYSHPSIMMKNEDGIYPMDMDTRDDGMMNSDDEAKFNNNNSRSKASIASIINVDTPVNNNYQNNYNHYNALPTPLSSSPSNGNNSGSSSMDNDDIEAAKLLISLRNYCEKVC